MADETKIECGGEGALLANSGDASFTMWNTMWKPKQYRCPVHGVTENFISSAVKGHEGVWCQICWLEALDGMGVHRMTEEATDG